MSRFSIFLLVLLMNTSLLLSLSGQGTDRLPRSIPESEGVSSAGILDFLNAIDTGKNEIHSFIFIRHGKIIAEGWWNPYGKELKHLMYSASKTFTATAVGLAVADNKLKLSDKIVSFFPGSLPDTLSDYMKMMTVRDLLTMSAGQDAEPRRGPNDDWIRSFLSKAPVYQPGTVFKYNNTATFMLSAIVQQVTGQTVFDYLQPRIFHPLGIHGIDWDLNPQGINLGLMGLRLRTEDMAKFGLLLLQKGVWNGKQLISREWIDEATSFKIANYDPKSKIPKVLNDGAQGYCYQMWRGRYNSVRLDGMAGQFVILLPEKDAIVVLTSNAANTQRELDLVWTYLLPAIKDSKALSPNQEMDKALLIKLSSLAIQPSSKKSVMSGFASKISGKNIELEKNNYAIQAVSFKFNTNGFELAIKRDDNTYYIKAGLDNWKNSSANFTSLINVQRPFAAKSIDANYKILQPVTRLAASYSWTDSSTLECTARFVEESLGSETIICRFLEEGGNINVTIEYKSGRGSGSGPGRLSTPPVLKGKLIF
jgi:CubicO group peptidase (beta-lactamase class C family)